jgi:hypothetical protein
VPEIRPEVLALLRRADLVAVVKAATDNPGMAGMAAIAGHGELPTIDGPPFTPAERELLATTTREEFEAMAAGTVADFEQVDMRVRDQERLMQLIGPYVLPGDESLQEAVERMPEAERAEAMQLGERLFGEEAEDQ